MKGKLVSVVVALLAVALVFPAIAEAQKFTGTGTVKAEGRGQIWARGRGEVAFQLDGPGRLVVRHRHANKIEAKGEGKRKVDGSTVIFTGFKGTVAVEGPKIGVRFSGGTVQFAGRGRGRVVLKGRGKYWASGRGPKHWAAEGAVVALGTPEEAEADEATGDNEAGEVFDADGWDYEDDTEDAVEEIKKFPSFKEWAEAHPKAVAALRRARNFHGWAGAHPKATARLFKHRHWKAWVAKHSRLAKFIRDHHAYVQWRKDHPDLAKYFKHPYACQHWLKNHPKAAAALKKGVPYSVWAKNHPAAAGALHRRRQAVKKRLDVKEDGKIDGKERRVGAKKAVDRNQDGHVDRKERAADALKRQAHQRRKQP